MPPPIDDRDLDAVGGHVGDLVGDGGHHVRVDTDLAAAEHLAAELEHDPAKRSSRVYLCHAVAAFGEWAVVESAGSDRA